MHKEAYLLFFGFASAVDFEFGETEQDTIDTLVKAYNEAPEEWKPELLKAGPEYLRIAITGEKDKPMWKPFVPNPQKNIDNMYKRLQEGKQIVLINKRKREIHRIFQSANTDEVFLISTISDEPPKINSHRYDDTFRKSQIEFTLSCSSYHEFDIEEGAMRFMLIKEREMKEEA